MFPPAGQSCEAAADLSVTGPSPAPADAKPDPLRCCWRPLGSLSLSYSHKWSLLMDTQVPSLPASTMRLGSAGGIITATPHLCCAGAVLKEGSRAKRNRPSTQIFAFSTVQTRMSQKGAAQDFSLSSAHPQHHERERQGERGADR